VSQSDVDLVRGVHPPSGTDLIAFFAMEPDGIAARDVLATVVTPDFAVTAGSLEDGMVLNGNGVDGLIDVWREWLSPWETYRTEVEEFVDIGDGRVLILVRDRGRTHGSAAEVEMLAASLWTVGDRRIARIEFHAKRESALRAAGLSGSG
jgi:ketosteroid isomerase-like protein